MLEKRAEEILIQTTKRLDGKWVSGLLWKDDRVEFPDSYGTALKRLLSLEKKFKRDEEFKNMYIKEVNKLFEAGYAEKDTNPEKFDKRTWYLPHFGVTNPNKPGKVRMVFDAANEVEGKSLNNQLLSGPDMLQSLFGVLLRFRQGKIGFSGDIEDMFLRVQVRSEDRSSQRFLWREKPSDPEPTVYVMKSLIFGATSSPCTAIFVKNENAKRFENLYPTAVEAVVKKHYVDDYVDSVDSVDEAKKLVKDVTMIHKSGGFRIRKWITNNLEVLKEIPKSEWKEVGEGESVERVLGVKWDTSMDTIIFDEKKMNISPILLEISRRPTKREVLKVVMSIFDPLGMLAPFTVQGRMLLQQIWRSKIGWDDKLEDQEFEKWSNWLEFLSEINNCRIPRCFFMKRGNRKIEIHTFSDASQEAYSAVCYLRIINEDGSLEISFVAGKAQVAPVKPVTIPRLELQAALIGCRLAQSITDELEIKIDRRYFWTDSRIVLCWIKNDVRRYNVFVANRLGEIDEKTDSREWFWIPTKENVADDATRWRKWPEGEERWLKGPQVLFQQEKDWPKLTEQDTIEDKCEVITSFLVTIESNTTKEVIPKVSRFSSWLRLVRSTARVLQALEYFSTKRSIRDGRKKCLELSMMQRAEEMLIKVSQNESFSEEIACLKQKVPLSRKSRILMLTPVLDEKGILRVDGRINKATGVPKEMLNPIILDGKSMYTRLLIRDYHVRFGHKNNETVINELRQRYWIVCLRKSVKSVEVSCQRCKIEKTQPEIPRMGDLPSARLEHHVRPFTNCGVDYFGPMMIKVGRRHEKRWGVLFTCLTTRAVHLELANSLSTDSAIMALRRMIARRGSPAKMYSDNGTNLRGAERELRKAIEEMDEEEISTAALNRGIDWRFIPPAAPHMGGSWERLVRSVKTTLKIILKERYPSEETLVTLLAEVENILNSRPLTYVSTEVSTEPSLTPNHFLIGGNERNVPGTFDETDLCLKKQWRTAQRLADHFWRRWIKEYLPSLIPRKRWMEERRNIKKDDIVLIVDSNLPRNVWPKGRVIEVIEGEDKRVRSAKVLVGGGQIMFRPVAKLIVIANNE